MHGVFPPWVADLIGREWHATDWNCYTMIQSVWREHLGKDLPDFVSVDPKDGHATAQAMQSQSDHWMRLDDGGELGDVAAIRHGRYVCHVGMIVAPWIIMHVSEQTPTMLEDLRESRWKHSLEGIYRRCP